MEKPKSIVLKCGSVVVLDPVSKVLKIFEEDGVDGAYIPPRVIRVCGEEQIIQLRDLLDEAFPRKCRCNGSVGGGDDEQA